MDKEELQEIKCLRAVLERILRVMDEGLFVDYQMEKFGKIGYTPPKEVVVPKGLETFRKSFNKTEIKKRVLEKLKKAIDNDVNIHWDMIMDFTIEECEKDKKEDLKVGDNWYEYNPKTGKGETKSLNTPPKEVVVHRGLETFRKSFIKIIENKQREILKKKYPMCVINKDKTKFEPEFEKDGEHLKVKENRMAEYCGGKLEIAYLFAQLLHEVSDRWEC